jgi:paraquat-inducible protein A
VPTSGDSASANLLECPDCGLVQQARPPRAGRTLRCVRCHGHLPGGHAVARGLATASTCVAALLLAIAISQPVFDMHLAGRYASAGLLTGPRQLLARGLPELALVVTLTLFVAPLAHLLILGSSVLGFHLQKPQRYLFMPLGLVNTARHWSMGDVFLLGALVCYVRLRAWGHVEIGSAVAALVALRIVTILAEAALDPALLWQRAPWHRPEQRACSDAATAHAACAWCGLVSRTRDGQGCPRCGRPVHARKPRSLPRASALLLAAGLLTIPANALPVMEMIRFGRPETDTIYSGVVELIQHDLWGLAVVIFVASIVIPLIKVVVLGLLLWTTAHERTDYLQARTRAYRFVHYVGRWSMVDVFAVTLLGSLVHMGILASVLPRYGAVAFCAVVLLTMWATSAFDPRLMWDAAGQNGPARRGRTR